MAHLQRSSSALRRGLWSALRLGVIVGVVLLITRLTGCMERMFYIPTAAPTPLSAAPAGAQEVWFTSADGTRLFGWFIPAHVVDESASAASILHVHGNAGNIQFHTYFTEHLPAAGFNVFIFDYRGYGQSEGRAHRRDDLIADTHAALDALLARHDIDPLRIGLYGQSLGGAIALNVMAERQEIRAGVIESAFTSWRDIAANVAGGDPPNFFGRVLAAMMISDHARPVDAIAQINRPLLLIHGDADTIIPVSHSVRLAAAAGSHAELVVLQGGDHNTLRTTHDEIDARMIEFFTRHLGR